MSLESLSEKETKLLRRSLIAEKHKWLLYLFCGILLIIPMASYFLVPGQSFADGFLAGMFFVIILHLNRFYGLISIVKKLIGKEGIKSIELGNAEKKD